MKIRIPLIKQAWASPNAQAVHAVRQAAKGISTRLTRIERAPAQITTRTIIEDQTKKIITPAPNIPILVPSFPLATNKILYFTFYSNSTPLDEVKLLRLLNNTWVTLGTITSPSGTIASFSWGASNRNATSKGEIIALDYFDDTQTLFVSLDYGLSWERKSIPAYPDTISIDIDGVYWLTCDVGILVKSVNHGSTWTPITSLILDTSSYNRIATHDSDANKISLTTQIGSSNVHVCVSIDNGVTWVTSSTSYSYNHGWPIWVGDRLVVFLTSNVSDGFIGDVNIGTSEVAVIYSDDFGITWSSPVTLFTNEWTFDSITSTYTGLEIEQLRIDKSPTKLFVVPENFPSPTSGKVNFLLRGSIGESWENISMPPLINSNFSPAGISWVSTDDALYISGAIDPTSSHIIKLPNASGINTTWEAAADPGVTTFGEMSITRAR